MTKEEDLKKILNEKEKQIAALREALAKSQEQIIGIHQSLPLRLFRDYDSSIGKLIPLRLKKKLKPYKKKSKLDSSEIIKTIRNKKTKKDIICFPMIPWNYRWQRPQHIFSEFAKNGHRVFYLTTVLQPLKNPYEINHLNHNIYEIEFSLPKYFDIYKDKINESILKQLIQSFTKLKNDLSLDAICFVMFPTWTPLVIQIKDLFGFEIIFDCVDEIQSFSNINKERKNEEKLLIKHADLITTSGNELYEKYKKFSKNITQIPNAVEFDHFNKGKSENLLKEIDKPIVGYFGAIAEWFDTDLIEFLAKKRPEYSFVFIGETYGSKLKKIQNLQNVYFLGERPYLELPVYLQDFDACLIPFKLTNLIKSAHPIKIYEYLATGKPVVATKMPELFSMKDLCYIAKDKDDFLFKLDKAIKENNDDLVKKRIDFAANNTWKKRFESISSALNRITKLDLESK